MGYQAESGAWRNAYLMGAAELRNGNLSGRARTANGLTNSMRAMTVSMLLDYIAILTAVSYTHLSSLPAATASVGGM